MRSLTLLVWTLAGSLCVTTGVNSQLLNASSLQSLFGPSLGPLSLNFLPANSKIFLLTPNQNATNPRQQFTPNFKSQPNLLVPNGFANSEGNTNQLDTVTSEKLPPAQIEVAQPVQSSASLENNTLLLQNPFASVPYQSNLDTINSLIANIFTNFSLGSLPPEELIFGALPSPNATVTRTFVDTIFKDDSPGVSGPLPTSTSSETETPTDGLRLDDFASVPDTVDSGSQPVDVEPDVNHLDNSVTSFGDNVVREIENWNAEFPTTLPESTTLPPTTEATFVEEPPTPLIHSTVGSPSSAPVTVKPVAPTMRAEFESNRIASLPPWSTIHQIVRPPSRHQTSLQGRPPPVPSPPPQLVSIESPLSAAIASQFATTRAPPPTIAPRFFKPSNSFKLNTLERKPKFGQNYFKKALPTLSGRAHFSFELNNRKIVGGKSVGGTGASVAKSSFSNVRKPVDLGSKTNPKTDSSIKPFFASLQTAPTTPAPPPAIASTPPPENESFSNSIQSNLLPETGNQKWKASLESNSEHHFGNLVNIISLPNYKFYLGKKT